MTWVGWCFSGNGWQCPREDRFEWHEADYFRVKEEDLEVVEAYDSPIKVGILRESKRKAKPVLVGPSDPLEAGYVWVTNVGGDKWVALGGGCDKKWARPTIIKRSKQGRKTA